MTDRELQAHEAVRRRSWTRAVTLYDQVLTQLSTTTANACNNNNSGNSQTTTANVIFNTAENNVLPQTPKERQITCLLGRAESLLELGRYESCLDDARNVLFLLVDQNDCLASLARARRWHVHALVKLKKYTEAEQVIREWIGALGAQQSFSDICKTLERYKSLIQLMSGQKSTQKPPQGRLDDEMSILDTKLDHWATNNLPLDKYSKLLSNKGLKKREAAAAAAAVAAATTMNNSKQDSTSASSASSVSSASSTASSVSSSSSSSTSASSPAASSPSANNVQQNGNNSDTCSISASASVAGSTTNSKNVVSGVRASASDSSLSNALSFHGNESVHSNNSPEFSVAHVSASSSQSSLSSATQNLVKTLEQLSFLQSESEKDPSEASSVADFPAGAGAGAATGLGSGADSGNADDETEEKIDASDTEIKCTYCAITFFSAHELNQHCQTESHQNMIMSDEGRDWKWRPPPRGFTLDTYSLCEAYSESQCCQYGNQCVEAHGQEELNEWNERFEYRRMRLQKACEKELFGKSYTEQILERWIQATAPERIMCEKVEDVIVKCEQELVTTISSKSSKREWVFLLQAQHPLKAVALLHDAHRHHFTLKSINAINMQGNLLQVELKCNQEWVSPAFSSFSRKSKTSSDEQNQSTDNSAGNAENEAMLEHQWQVTIEFRTEIYGTFRQAVCFDIGQEPRLVRNVCVDVVPVSDVEKLEVIKRDIISNTAARWDVSNTQLYKYETNVPDHQKTEAFLQDMRHEREMLERYPCPRAHNFTLTQSTIVEKRLTPNNYRARTHELLFVEEIARYEQIARFNVRTKLNVTSNYILTPAGMATSTAKYSLAGELFALMQLSKDISEDTSAGRLILSNCMSVYISLPENENERETREKEGKRRAVYEALIEDKGKNEIYLKLSAKCVEMMGLKSDTDIEVDVQFQLNRLPYCEWHSAVDKITDFKIIFPTTELDTSIPWTPKKQWSDTAEPKLNAKQREAVNAITANMAVKLPPILLIGPFGTGKTYTLAQAIKQLLLQEDAKILICTHSNSAADLYIKEYLHPWIEEGLTEATPLRVYYHKRWVATVNSIVKQYCITDGNGSFRRPSMEDIMKYRIVVVTLSISMELATIGLPKGYFTHIFLDEAAQAMECEAIMPLALANDSTRIVLAGDHMQMSPELFSAFAMERKLHISLLERLYSHYPSNFASKILLCENYRAHEAIIRFTSELFYEQKLISSGKQPRHERFYPLTFFTTRGEDVQDKNSTAFYNNAEVYELVERVSELRKKWPSSWGKMNDGSIGIMTPYADQVFRIRSELRKRRMGGISVERVLNVQGKQFRAVFLSTVRTRRTCLPSGGLGGVQASTGASNANEDTDYGFLSNSKLLNTAITRAQSLVAVVGDPVALCSIGRCRKVWERFIEICDENKSLFGITWSYLRSQLDGVELKRGYVLNPLAPEFVPRALQPEAYLREQAAMYMLSGHSTPGSHHPLSGSPAVGTPTHHVHMPPPPGAIGPPPNGPPHGVMMYGHGPQMHNNLSNASGTGLNVHGQPAGPQNSQSAQQQQQVSQMMHPALAAAFNAAMVMMNQPPPSTGGKNNGGGNANGNNFNPPVPPNANNHMLGMRGNAQQVVPPTAAQQPFMGVRGGQQNSGPGGPSGVAPPPPPPGQYSQYMAWQQAAAAQQQQQMRGGNTVAVNATNSNQGGAQNINSSLWGPPPQNNPWSVLPQNKSVPPQVATATVASNTRQQQPTQVPQTSVAAIQQQRCGSVQANALVQQQQQQQTAAANYQKKPTLYGAVGGVGGAVLPSGPQQQVAPPHGNFGVGGFNQMQMLNVHGRGGHMPNGPISPMDPFMSRLPGAGVGPIGQQAPPPGLTQPQVPPQQQQAQQQQGSKDFQAYANNNNNNMQLNSSGNNNNSNNNNNIGGNNNLFSNLLPLPVNGGGSGVSTGGNNNNNVSNNNNNNNNNTMNKQQSPTVSRYSQAQEYAMLLPPNMSIYEMAFEPKENQYNWYLKVLEMHGQEAANKFTEMLRHTMNNLIHHPLQPQQQQLPHILAAQQQQLAAIKPPLQPGVTPQQQQHQQLNQLLSQRNNDMLQTPSPQMLNTAAQQQHARGVNGGTGVGGGPYMNPLAGIVGNPASALLPLQQLAMNNSISGLDDSLTPLMADAAVGAGVNFNQQIDLVFNSLMNGIEMSQPILRDLLGMLGTGGATGGSGGTTGGNGVTPTTVNHIQTSSNGPDAMHVNHQQQQQQHHHQQQQQLFHQQQQLLQQQQRQQQQQQQAQQQAAVHSKMFPLINNSLQQQQAGNTQQQLISTSLNYFAAPTSQQPQQQQLTKSQQQLMRNQQQNGQQQQTQALTSPLQQQQQQQQQQPSGTTTTPTFIGSPLLRQHEILLCDFGNMPGSGTSVPLYRRQAVGGSASQPSANNNNNSNNLGLNIGCDFASNNSLFSSGANAGGTNKNNLSPHESNAANNILVGIGGTGNLIEALFQSNNADKSTTNTTNVVNNELQQQQQQNATNNFTNIYGNYKPLNSDLDIFLRDHNNHFVGGNTAPVVATTVTTTPSVLVTNTITTQRAAGTTPNVTTTTQQPQQQGGGYASVLTTPTATYAAVLSQGSHNHSHHGQTHMPHSHTTRVPPTTATSAAGNNKSSEQHQHQQQQQQQYHQQQQHVHHKQQQQQKTVAIDANKIANKELKNKSNNNNNNKNSQTNNMEAVETDKDPYATIRELGQGTNGYYNYFQ